MEGRLRRGITLKKILIITDSYNWATYFRAENLKKYLIQYEIDIVSFKDISKYNLDNYNVVYITNWPIYGYVSDKISTKRKYKLVTGISSHIGRKSADQMTGFFRKFDAIGTSNMILYKEFLSAKLPSIYTPFGANSDTFVKKTNLNKFKNVFGWVGNKDRAVKRFSQIEKIFLELGKEYTLKVVDHTRNFTHSKMCEFYNSIGTIICFSESEGTPNPILEAAMCGRWIISPSIGNVPELTMGIKHFRPAGNVLDLKKQIMSAANNQDLDLLGEMVLKEATQNWTWEMRSKNFIELFE